MATTAAAEYLERKANQRLDVFERRFFRAGATAGQSSSLGSPEFRFPLGNNDVYLKEPPLADRRVSLGGERDGVHIVHNLSLRQFELLRFMATHPLDGAQVAAVFHVKPDTIRNHSSALRAKLGLGADVLGGMEEVIARLVAERTIIYPPAFPITLQTPIIRRALEIRSPEMVGVLRRMGFDYKVR